MDAYIYEVCDRPGIEDDLLYALAFGKAFEFDHPSSILEEGAANAARALMGIALGGKLEPIDVAILRDFYDALKGRGGFRLKLMQARRGRLRTGEELLKQANADKNMLRLVGLLTKKLGKREAAVNAASHALKVSRATIFNQMRRAQRFDREVRDRAALNQFAGQVAGQSLKNVE